MREVDIMGISYQIGELDAIRQFHLARRLAPLQLALGLSMIGDKGELLTGDAIMTKLMGMLGPVIEVLSKMPQDDADYVLRECLSVAKRKQDGGWAPMLARSGAVVFADLKMPELVRICIEVLRENLGNFFGPPSGGTGSPTSSEAQAPQ